MLLSGRRKLLLADDSPTVQKVISLFLEEEGVEVVAVGDGREALRLLEEERPPDILIADVWMPGPDGYELCERVKSDERLRHIPVILLVSKFEPFNEAEARRVGADTVLTKPFQSIRDLVSRVGSLLGGGSKREETAPEQTPREESAAEASHARAESQATAADARAPHADAQTDERGEAFDSELAQPFGDPGADDELIEAKPAESFFEPARAEAAERAAAPEEIEVSEQAEEFETIAHAPDVFAARHEAAHEPFGTNGQAAISHEAQHAGESLMPARSSFAARAAGAAAADDALLDLGQFEPPTSGHAAEADDFILDLEEDLPAPHAAQNLFAQPDEPSAFAEASHGTPSSSFDEPASSFGEPASSFGESASSFDLSAQPHDAAQGHDAAAWEVVRQEPEVVAQDEPQFSAAPRPAHEAGPAPRGFVEPSVVPAEEPVPATFESEYADGSVEGDVPKPPAVAHAAPSEGATTAASVEEAPRAAPVEEAASVAHEMGGAREAAAPSEPSPASYAVGEARAGVEESERASQLSREDVDAIARRVVELMSERVIREIAWEVVPELAELLVKRKLEEEGQK